MSTNRENQTMIENARINSVDIFMIRKDVLSCYVNMEMSDGNQSFGGWILGGNPFEKAELAAARYCRQPNYAGDFLAGLLVLTESESLSDVAGKIVRFQRDHSGKIEAIGHPFKDIWYRPNDRFSRLREMRLGTLTEELACKDSGNGS